MVGSKLQRVGLILATVMTAAGTIAGQRPAAKTETAVFAGGCFWGIQAVFQHTKGVTSAVSGYSGGWTDKPSYEMVGTGTTGHAESVQVTFDPARISYATLLKIFFSVAHDPTQLNRQGPDVGTQYRSSLFYMSDEQKKTAESYIDVLNKGHAFGRPIVTEVVKYKATLDGGQQSPPVTTKGKGTATLTFDTAKKKLSWNVKYSGLSGPATAAHIHGPAAIGTNAPILFPLPLGTVNDFAFSPTAQQVTEKLLAGDPPIHVQRPEKGQLLISVWMMRYSQPRSSQVFEIKS